MTLALFLLSFGSMRTSSGTDQWTAPHRKPVRTAQPKDSTWRSARGSATRSSASTRFRRSTTHRATLERPTVRSYRPVIHTEQIDAEGSGPDLLPSPQEDAQFPSQSEDDELREEYQDECQRSLATLRGSKLSDISLDIAVNGTPGTDYPRACVTGVKRVRLAELKLGERDRVNVAWTASGLCHKPLYFEETNLERYGQTAGPLAQPVLSAAHFFATLPVLPYKMGLKPPGECIYTLGHYRPGDCAPHYIPAVPISLRAGLVQAGAMVGAAAILP